MCSKVKTITTHARHDPGHCMCPGLFRSLKRGERKHQKLDITYRHGSTSLRFWGPEPLGADDLRVMQAVVALAGVQGGDLGPDPRTDDGKTARQELNIKNEVDEGKGGYMARAVRTTVGEIMREIGLTDNGRTRAQMITSLNRLSAITIIARSYNRSWSSHVMGYAMNHDSGQITIGVNPALADSIVDARHTRIDMNEVRALAVSSDAARLIHQRLSALIPQGQKRTVSLNTLCGYVYPCAANNAPAERKRQQRVAAAVQELAAAGWLVTVARNGFYSIQRPGLLRANSHKQRANSHKQRANSHAPISEA